MVVSIQYNVIAHTLGYLCRLRTTKIISNRTAFLLLLLAPHASYAQSDVLDFIPAILAGIDTDRVITPPEPIEPPPPAPSGTVDIVGEVLNQFRLGLPYKELIGQIQNNTNSAIQNARITVIDADGRVHALDPVFGSVFKTKIAPSETACFNVLVYGDTIGGGDFEPHGVTFEYTQEQVPDVSFSRLSIERSINDSIDFQGRLYIRGDIGISSPKLVTATFGSDGVILDCRTSSLSTSYLRPKVSYSFDINSYHDFSETSTFSIDLFGD